MSESNNQGFNLDDPSLISVLDELPFWSAPFGIKLLEKVIPKKNMAVLDIGFGTGFPLTELAGRLGETCRIYGIDPWKAAADRVTEKIRIYATSNIELLIGTAENIPLPDNSLDLIVSNNGLNNVEDMDLVLSECARTLKKNGRLVFTMNTEGTMMEFYEVMEQVLVSHQLEDSITDMHRHIHDKRKPLDEVSSILLEKGFYPDNVEHDRFSYKFADGTAMFRHFFIRLAFLEAWLKIVPETRREEIFNRIENVLNEISEEKGYFELTIPFVVISAIKP